MGVNPPLLSPNALTGIAAAAATAAAVMSPPLLSPDAPTETAATATATVPSQTTHAPPSPTGGDAAHRTDTTCSSSPSTLTLRNCTSRTPGHDKD
ncbi:unnamed protein product [Closterium sp. Naga37s-1]|nr:unnamed protein product [Closterium sp. Naga37s-1]